MSGQVQLLSVLHTIAMVSHRLLITEHRWQIQGIETPVVANQILVCCSLLVLVQKYFTVTIPTNPKGRAGVVIQYCTHMTVAQDCYLHHLSYLYTF